MTIIKKLLELRKQIKSKKPKFIRQDSHKKKRLGSKWRRPKGLQSKMRLNLRGRSRKISKGYRSPKKVRYMHKSGLMPCIVRTFSDLESIDAKKNCLIISSSLGNKKRIAILKKAKELGLNISNIKNPEDFIKSVEDKILLRKKIKEKKK
ncbi:MAG: 50S ribosomal protein L32e [Nanoarchaeota archaeon]|nr:50S ribosomal protein L32e [Nanoarchaeota archaeon]